MGGGATMMDRSDFGRRLGELDRDFEKQQMAKYAQNQGSDNGYEMTQNKEREFLGDFGSQSQAQSSA